MLSTLSILSPDQGKLTPKGETEDQYFARFMPPEPTEMAEKVVAILRQLPLIRRKPVLRL